MAPPARNQRDRLPEPTPLPAIEPMVFQAKPIPGLVPYRSEAIAGLTAKARVLWAERDDNNIQIDKLNARNAGISRELQVIMSQVVEHAWDGNPLS